MTRELILTEVTDQMPDEFTLIVPDLAIALHVDDLPRLRESWNLTKAELIRRGYEVTEWRDELAQQGCAKCRRTSAT